MEHAIKAHIKVKLDEDPEYYQFLSLRLQEIIQKCENRWEELVQQLLLFRDGMEREKTQQDADLGLSDEEGAFYRVLMKEVPVIRGFQRSFRSLAWTQELSVG